MLDELQHGEVREIRLARPPANALTHPLLVQLTQRLRAAALEGSRAVVLSGQPGMFSAGLEVAELITQDWGELQRFMRALFALEHQLAVQPVPVVVAITGHCMAAAAVLTLFCDYRIMSTGRFKIGMNDVTVGLCPGRLAYQACQRLLGARHADRLMTRGELLGPDEALRIGLVDRLAAPEQVVIAAIEFAQSYLLLPQQALYETRRIARGELVRQCDDALRDESEDLHQRWFGAEAQQGLLTLAARLAGDAVS